MIFIRYENWRSYLKYYPVTSLILVINLVMYCVLLFNGGAGNMETLFRFGAVGSELPYSQDWWRYVTAIFLHLNFSHLLFNCFAILVFAPPLERLLGWWRYLLVYLVSGVLGNALSMAFYRHAMEYTLSVGASGAIYGVYGAFLYIALLQRNLIDEGSRKTLYAILLVGIIFSFAMTGTNWMAHLGGLIGGFFVYGLLIRLTRRFKT
ncbi:rhomboid family intramembrane serine protease [Paenibacillus physcomitrellae]|uniref:Rhomboid protease YdcA n=1 Tax=Paenibacillus physcomitrellae TaxID=1619311 RepID=A0ABQ1GJE1_9BACL|nr:rhomboid family intramembrane serine protease [Paenibacillus physcomitrellae]GGA44583.1 putative rhomboid protease YdcA [Paenibacillus physcomitrellae]